MMSRRKKAAMFVTLVAGFVVMLVGGAAIFLASDDASYITGDVIRIDGGMLAQQRSATVDIKPPSDFPKVEDL